MLVFFGKYSYAILLCIPLLLQNNCDDNSQLLAKVRDEKDLQIYKIAACTAKHLLKEIHETFETSLKICNSTDSGNFNDKKLREISENFHLNLICRKDRSLTFRIEHQSSNNSSHKSLNIINPVIYVIRAILTENNFIYLSNDTFFTIDKLESNKMYNITVVAVYSTDEYSIIASHQQYSTLRRGYRPNKIANIHSKFESDEADIMKLKTKITWTPSSDRTCDYNIIWYPTNNVNFDLIPLEIRNPRKLYNYTLEDRLNFSTIYKVGIFAINVNAPKESETVWEEFLTPSCLEWHHNNLSICPPPNPTDLAVEQKFISDNKFSLNISWQRPHEDFLPDYYTVKFLDLFLNTSIGRNSKEFNVTKDKNFFFIPSMAINGMMFEVILIAHSPGGQSVSNINCQTEMRVIATSNHLTDKTFAFKAIIAIVASMLCISIIIIMIYIIFYRRAKLQRIQERCKYFEELEKKAPIDPKSSFDFLTQKLSTTTPEISKFQLDLEEKLLINDALEIDRNNLILHEVIGEGAFGLVRRGTYKAMNLNAHEVAVKMLKDRPSTEDVRAFRREIEVMKSVGKHPNIVGIIGHSIKHQNEMLLLTEYCNLGNLQNFLREEWKYLQEVSKDLPKPKLHARHEDNIFNFDSSFVNRIKTKQKPTSISTSINGVFNETEKTPHFVLFNSSYGYEEICNSFCKCQVDILPFDHQTTNSKITISRSCECRRKSPNHQQSLMRSIENKGYCWPTSDQRPATQQNNQFASSDELLIASVEREPLRPVDLLDIARQVAMGMEFLSKNKVVHRDLAARNILVSTDRTVKIADFGLSRDVYQENVYKKTGNGKLPIKWLALESITHQVYTSHSDVWSFGILLYEIVTLGGIPYASISTTRLLPLLKTGYRMEKPKHCGQEFYKLMYLCWNANPGKRPTFAEIVKTLDRLIMDCPERQIESFSRMKRPGNNTLTLADADDEYLKPL